MHVMRAADGFSADTRAASGRKHNENLFAASAASSWRTATLRGWKKWHSGTVAACIHTIFSGRSTAHDRIPTYVPSGLLLPNSNVLGSSFGVTPIDDTSSTAGVL